MNEAKLWDLYNKYIKLQSTLKGAGVHNDSATVFELSTTYYENSQNNDEFKQLLNDYVNTGFSLPITDFDQASFIIALSSFSFPLI